MLLKNGGLGDEASHSTSKEALGSLRALGSAKTYTLVNWHSAERSKIPLASFGFYDCSALALFYDDHSAGLVHMIHNMCVPDERMVQRYFDQLTRSSETPMAFVVANSISRIETIVGTVRQRGAMISGTYLFPEDLGAEPKDVIVFPYFRQIRIYSSLGTEERTV